RVPAALALMFSSLFAGLLACFTQTQAVAMMADPTVSGLVQADIKAAWQVLATGFEATSGIGPVDALLSRGGMARLLPTIWLMVVALVVGSRLHEFGFLSKRVTALPARARTTGSLIGTAVGAAIGLDGITADQYVALVLPTRLFR